MANLYGTQNCVSEWSYTAARQTDNPFSAVDLDVEFTHEGGSAWKVPAFWAGGQEWRVRFAPLLAGRYTFRTVCSDSADNGLHGQTGQLVAEAYTGDHPLLKHGPLRASADQHRFVHADGAPFFWLADTWWMGFTKRLSWPDDFQLLAADRAAKGFTAVQIVAGLYPDMDWYDPRGANEAGFPYDKELTRINPAYYDTADLKVQHLVRSGLMPCIVGCWGYFLTWIGVERMKKHWRYLIARWGAYPVVWCLAGEGTMPYYLSKTPEQDAALQKQGWTEIGHYVRATDPMQRLITIHAGGNGVGRDNVADDSVLDFDLLQTGHSGYKSIPNTIAMITAQCARQPARPVIDGEVNYEGFLYGNFDEVQRLAFWGCMLSGAAGHTYGANGIWQVNTRETPYGPSPHGNTWGNRPWDEAMRLPGAGQLALGKRLLQRYAWWDFQPHQEWVDPAATPDDPWKHYAAGIPGHVRVIYMYGQVWGRKVHVRHIEPGVPYRAFFMNPSSGQEYPLGIVEPEVDGSWLVPQQPEVHDWLLVLERA
ncbi:MAG: DUF4038 domain-containing protein [Chloroflexi bacterium]|nr:DUF4038 domain-containing protein [Chloroflexota bacterium]MCL5273292.1 DUF4038 domain-containing protein [Chloroflexota bacterium]